MKATTRLKKPGILSENSYNLKRVVGAAAICGILVTCIILGQAGVASQSPRGNSLRVTVVPEGGDPYWNIVGSMIFYRNGSESGNRSYWVAQTFEVVKPSPTSVVVRLLIYIWVSRDIPSNPSKQMTADNITVLLTNTTADGTPNIDYPILNQSIGPENISATGPYPKGLMSTNSSQTVLLNFTAPNPMLGFAEGNYSIFLYRTNLGDNDDYHIGYAYYWAASKLDLYYGGGSWLLNSTGQWNYYPNDMCFALVEIALP
jgi:hypothetical protein